MDGRPRRSREGVAPEAFTAALNQLAPPSLAESWDNVGTIVAGDRPTIARVLLAIDLTDAVMDESMDQQVDAIVAYHPPIFDPLRRLDDSSTSSRVARRAAREGILVCSPHTALDAAPGGVNDWLVRLAGAGEVEPLKPASPPRASEAFKVVTFAPAASIDALREAMSKTGAGRIGAYDSCSFVIDGVGTFHGGKDTRPHVGRRGRLERVSEQRLEMVCGERELAAAIAGLRRAHPYEEPPIEIHPLRAVPRTDAGAARVISLARPAPLASIASRIRRALRLPRIDVAEARAKGQARRLIRRLAACAGSGGSLLDAVRDSGCEAFLTGELPHHKVLAATSQGMAVLLAGHSESERGYLPVLARRLREVLPGVEILVSRADRPPLRAVTR